MNVAGLWVAALSAIGFAVSTSLQHRVNTGLDAAGPTGARILARLLREPWWVVGQALALVAFVLHASALHLGLLVVVQPVVVSGIVLAVPVRAALERRMPGGMELAGVAITATGLALLLVSAHPGAEPSTPTSTWVTLAVTLSGVVLALAISQWATLQHDVRRAAGYGVAAGILFGLTAGLVKLAGERVSEGASIGGQLVAVAIAWPAWVAVVVGLSGVVLNQRAYRAGPLSASMPVLNVVDVLVALAFGVFVLGEMPDHHVWPVLGECLGIASMALGLRTAARATALRTAGPMAEAEAVSGGAL